MCIPATSQKIADYPSFTTRDMLFKLAAKCEPMICFKKEEDGSFTRHSLIADDGKVKSVSNGEKSIMADDATWHIGWA